jgi:hypothetical protein
VRSKSSERRFEAGKVLKESAGTKEERGNSFFDSQMDESSEGRSPRALGAERGFLGTGNERPREGSQTLRRRTSERKANFFQTPERVRRRVPGSQAC